MPSNASTSPAMTRCTSFSAASLTETDLGGGTFLLQGFYSKTLDVFGGGVFSTFQDPAINPTGHCSTSPPTSRANWAAR